MEFGDIAAFGQIDPQRVVRMIVGIIEELGPEAARLSADDGIGLRIVRGIAFEDVNADDGFLQHLTVTGQRLINYKTKEAAHALRVGEFRAGQHPVEVLAYCVTARLNRDYFRCLDPSTGYI